jgi:glycosyltransferase involved in cell wall biosynthesis
MKIVYLHQYFNLPSQSGSTRSFDLASHFNKSGYSIEIITATSNLNFKTSERWNSVCKDGLLLHYIYLPYSNDFSYIKRIFVFIKFLFFATLKILTIKCDVVLATSTPLSIGVPALVKKLFHKTPFVFEVRDVWPEAVIAIGAIRNFAVIKFLFFLEKIIYSYSDAIVPLSTDMKNSIIKRYPRIGLEKPIVVIENISEIDRFKIKHSDQKFLIKTAIGFQPRFVVLYAGTFGKVNGVDFVVNLAEKTLQMDESIVYILMGEGAYKEYVRNLAIEKMVLNKNFFIFDSISKEDLPYWYYEVSMGSSFVIQIQELWANSANKFFDTLAAGKPILINYLGWQKELIEKENLGYVLPEIITDNIAKNFVKYTKDFNLIETQKKNALNVAKSCYSLNVAVNKYTNLFETIRRH